FPPFSATAPTVLSQLFRVLEATYGGDGLGCLLDFLIPSKRLLEHVRQAACAPYFGCLFLHEGWPLCLREKVVVHLGPLNPLLLRPGDFYLQAEPCGEQSACLAVKCLSRDLTSVEKIPVPEASCSLPFTEGWLEEVTQGLGRPALHTCLVATGNGIVPIPWSKIVAPEFVQGPKMEALAEHDSSGGPEACCPPGSPRQSCPLAAEGHRGPGGPVQTPPGKYPGLIKVEQGSWKKSSLFVVPSLCDIISENLEGEYVNLLGFSEETKPSISAPAEPAASPTPARDPPGTAAPESGRGLAGESGSDEATAADWDCGMGPHSTEGPCTPCLRRKLIPDPKDHESRCRYRESYMAALKNPVSFSSGLMAAILEEMDVAKQAAPPESASVPPSEGPGQAAPRFPSVHPEKDEKVDEASKPGPAKLPKSPAECPAASNKFSFLKGPRQLPCSPAGLAAPEKAGKRQEGPRRRTLIARSPRTVRAKPAAAAGKGDHDKQSKPLFTPPGCLPRGCSGGRGGSVCGQPVGPRLLQVARWAGTRPLQGNGAGLPCWGTDRLGRPVVQVTTNDRAWAAPWCSAREVTRLLLHLFSLARKQWSSAGLTVVIDARKEPPSPTLSAALGATWRRCLGRFEKRGSCFVELLSSLKALGRHVDGGQLTQALDGQFPYCHGAWVQFFQVPAAAGGRVGRRAGCKRAP
uniref:Uncharacterized protein n=1 Tax=Varanus komodoensis TaxID=61221 RepID=A0A8D2L232_VARKO